MRAVQELLGFLRKDDSPKATMAELQERFLAPSAILETTPHELGKVSLSESEAQLLSLIPGLTRHAMRTSLGDHPMLGNLLSAAQYLRTLFIGVPIEQFYLLCMDESGRLIQCRLLQSGSIDETPFYLGNLLQCVVSTGARAVVLSHNHPGGTPRPSQADVRCTIDALRALLPLNVTLLDHIIIADGRAVSLRLESYIADPLWNRQQSAGPLFWHWTDPE